MILSYFSPGEKMEKHGHLIYPYTRCKGKIKQAEVNEFIWKYTYEIKGPGTTDKEINVRNGNLRNIF